MFWQRLTTRGALVGGMMGLLTAVTLTVLGPAVWVKVLGHAQPIFPYDAPGLFSMTIAFAGCWLFSVLDSSAQARAEQAQFESQMVRAQTGIGAAVAATH
jgi:cation/acetate symporter